MRLIETTDLRTWAGSKPAEGRLPYWVKQLICAVIEPDKIRFPTGDAIWVPGCDGAVLNTQENRFVPTGYSVWEVSTERTYQKKALKVYSERSQNDLKGITLPEGNRSAATFVFVTPLVWPRKERWALKRRKEAIWNDVIVLDGVDLQDWLESAPVVSLQFAAELGLVPEVGLWTPDQAWDEWSHFSHPPVSEDLVLAGRPEQEKELVNILAGRPSTVTIRGDSPREAWGFALAALRRQGSELDRTTLYARTIIADDEQVASRLRNRKNLIIVLKEAKGQVSGNLSAGGAHVVIPEGNESRSERNVIVLSRPTHRVFADALEQIGLPEEEAEKATRECGRSVTILQRQRAHSNLERPKWADGPVEAHLLAAVLVGRWNSSNEHDQKTLCKLAGVQEYTEVEGKLQNFLWVDEPPLQKIDEMWTLTAPVDAFQLIARHLTSVHLERFKQAFQEVFGRLDPKVEIPPDDWLYHDIKGEQGHSGWLRAGMAETLLLIAERGTDAGLVWLTSPRNYADDVIQGLPALNDDWRTLASLRDQCARLMEAVPDVFLKSFERILEVSPQNVPLLFAESSVLGTGAIQTGLLWGLETLAWSPDYLPRVGLILAQLARLDPGGRFANRPINSLREIFLWWYPGTNASLARKLEVLDLILDRESEVGWALLAMLLPSDGRSTAHLTAKPRWKDFGELPEEARTTRGQFMYLCAIVDRALNHVGCDPGRWGAVFEAFPRITRDQQESALTLLDEIAATQETIDKQALWEKTREFVYRRRATGALPVEMIDRFEAILARLSPIDPVARNRWLFDAWVPPLPFPREEVDRVQERLEGMRNQAIKMIMNEEGKAGLVRLGTSCSFPESVATTVVAQMDSVGELLALIHESITSGDRGLNLASEISGAASKAHGDIWRDLLLGDAKAGIWPPTVVASLILWWPDDRETWQYAEDLGELVKAHYWQHKPISFSENREDRLYVIDQLIEVGRPAAAFHRIALYGTKVPPEVLLKVFDATFDQLMSVRSAEEFANLGLSSNYVREFLDRMRDCEDMPRQEVVYREYRALLLFDLHEARGLTIHEFLAEDPNFYVQVLCDAFLPEHRDDSKESKLTAQQLAQAKAGYRLLEGMTDIPGQLADGEMDEDALLRWINSVRELAAERDRSEIAEEHIGKLVAHAPVDPNDGGWPHRVVRNIIERLASDIVETGLINERFKMRGFSVRGTYEGGAQERDLARQYLDWASILGARWLRMERILREIAQDWEDYARRQDALVEQYKMELE